jgi:hypothetical protein
MLKRRYEILLPAKYNDGREVMQICMACFPQTFMAVADQFGAFSYNPHSILGVWTAEGQRHHDESLKHQLQRWRWRQLPTKQRFANGAHFGHGRTCAPLGCSAEPMNRQSIVA